MFLLVLGLCSSDHPDVFATASLHVSQGKPLHDDIVPEVAEELGPGGHCMATYPCVVIHLQQTYIHKQIRSYMLTALYICTPSRVTCVDLVYPHTHASNHTCTFAFIFCVEALIRFLKAKLRVMQEEMDRMNAEAKEKVCVLLQAA